MCGTSNPNPKPRIYNDPNKKKMVQQEKNNVMFIGTPDHGKQYSQGFSITPFPTTSAIATTTTATPTSSFAPQLQRLQQQNNK